MEDLKIMLLSETALKKYFFLSIYITAIKMIIVTAVINCYHIDYHQRWLISTTNPSSGCVSSTSHDVDFIPTPVTSSFTFFFLLTAKNRFSDLSGANFFFLLGTSATRNPKRWWLTEAHHTLFNDDLSQAGLMRRTIFEFGRKIRLGINLEKVI